jgi:hypothetical protein
LNRERFKRENGYQQITDLIYVKEITIMKRIRKLNSVHIAKSKIDRQKGIYGKTHSNQPFVVEVHYSIRYVILPVLE